MAVEVRGVPAVAVVLACSRCACLVPVVVLTLLLCAIRVLSGPSSVDKRLHKSPYFRASSKSKQRGGTAMSMTMFVPSAPHVPTLPRDFKFGARAFTFTQLPGRATLRPYAPTDALYKTNLPSVGKLRRELLKVKESMGELDEDMVAKVKQMMVTLPLEFLLAQGGMYADYVRQRCRSALGLLFAGVWENTTAAAMEKWKVRSRVRRSVRHRASPWHRARSPQGLVRMQRAEEAKALYRFNKAKRRLRDTMTRYFRRIHRGKMSVVWAWWVQRTRTIRGIENDWASRMVRHAVAVVARGVHPPISPARHADSTQLSRVPRPHVLHADASAAQTQHGWSTAHPDLVPLPIQASVVWARQIVRCCAVAVVALPNVPIRVLGHEARGGADAGMQGCFARLPLPTVTFDLACGVAQRVVRGYFRRTWYRRLRAAVLVVQNAWRTAKCRRIVELMIMATRMNEETRVRTQ